MVVRFITRRFIGEYDPNLEKIYSFSTIIDNEMVLFEILDAAGQLNVSNEYFSVSRSVFGRRKSHKISYEFTGKR